jgi:hypothetical protein
MATSSAFSRGSMSSGLRPALVESRKIALRLVGTYAIAIAVMVAALVASNALPNDRIGDNVRYSMAKFGYERSLIKWGAFDLFTECVGVTSGLVLPDENTTPISRALLSPTLFQCEDAVKAFETGAGGFNYWRYWHGYQVFSRPILYFLDVHSLRTLVAFTFLLTCFLFYNALRQHAGQAYANFLLLSLFFTASFSHLILVTHALVWILGFAAGSWLIHVATRPGADLAMRHYLVIFFLIGMCTSYVDLLTAPLVTLTIPLLGLYLIDQWPQSVPERRRTIAIVLISGIWALGYVSCWVTKWALAGSLLGSWEDVLAIVSYRMSGSIDNEPATWMDSLAKNFYEMRYGLVALAALMLARLAWCWRQLRNPFSSPDQAVAFIILLLLPIVWMVVIKNHSIVHAWFVSPILVPSMVLAMSGVWRATSVPQGAAGNVQEVNGQTAPQTAA